MTNAATPINAQVAAAVAQQRANLLDPTDHGQDMLPSFKPPKGIARLLGDVVARSFLTVVSGHGGSSKSTYVASLVYGLVLGRPLVGPGPVPVSNALYLGLEDDMNMVGRMFAAVALKHNLTDRDRKGKLTVYGKDSLMRQVKRNELSLLRSDPTTKEVRVNDEALLALEMLVQKHDADVLVLDPLAVLYGGAAISNETQNLLSRTLSDMASRLDIAVVIVAHNRKPSSGAREQDQHDTKHGSELVDTARAVVTVQALTTRMIAEWRARSTPAELMAARFATVTKSNIGPAGQRVFYLVGGQPVPCADGKVESVGVVEAWQPPAALPPDGALLLMLKPHIEGSFVYASPSVGKDKAAEGGGRRLADVLEEVCGDAYDVKAARKRLFDEGWLTVEEQSSPAGANKHRVKRVVMGAAAEGVMQQVRLGGSRSDLSDLLDDLL